MSLARKLFQTLFSVIEGDFSVFLDPKIEKIVEKFGKGQKGEK